MTDLLALLQAFHHEKLALVLRHESGARLVGQYDANNTYQYIINREEAQLSWLATAIAELGGASSDGASERERTVSGKRVRFLTWSKGAQAIRARPGTPAR